MSRPTPEQLDSEWTHEQLDEIIRQIEQLSIVTEKASKAALKFMEAWHKKNQRY